MMGTKCGRQPQGLHLYLEEIEKASDQKLNRTRFLGTFRTWDVNFVCCRSNHCAITLGVGDLNRQALMKLGQKKNQDTKQGFDAKSEPSEDASPILLNES